MSRWIIDHLRDIPLLARGGNYAHAADLLSSGRIALFLDGLDDMPDPDRVVALSRLDREIEGRLVLFVGTSQLAAAARQQSIVSRAVVLEPVPLGSREISDHLWHDLTAPPHPARQRVLAALREYPVSPLTIGLSTPRALKLLDMVYPAGHPGDGIGELLNIARFPTPSAITDHLLGRAVTDAYAPPSRYSDTGRGTLRLIADHLGRHQTRDISWWSIPDLLPPRPRAAVTMLVALGTAMVIGILGLLVVGWPGGLAGWLVGWGISVEPLGRWPFGTGRFSFPDLWATSEPLFWGTIATAVAAVVLAVILPVAGAVFAAAWILVLMCLLRAGWAYTVASVPAMEPARWPLTPVESVAGLAAFVVGLSAAGQIGWVFALLCALIAGAVTGLAVSSAGRVLACQRYLSRHYGTPSDLMRFLEDARRLGFVRRIGPAYQFCDDILPERLTGMGVTGFL